MERRFQRDQPSGQWIMSRPHQVLHAKITSQAGWMGKTRDPSKEEAAQHVSRPLSTLKDPSLFGPPPKHVNYHGGAALPHEITPHTTGLGAPLTPEQRQEAARVTRTPPQEEPEEETRRPGPPVPYRADRTGLKTDHLPPPPVHRDINRSSSAAGSQSPKPKPHLPPRLPSRQNTGGTITTPPAVTASPPPQQPPPTYSSIPTNQPTPQPSPNYGINQGAVNRLGQAGVSVPGLGIGSTPSSNPWQNESSQSNVRQSPSPQPPQPPTNQLSELQSRFARITTSTNGRQPLARPPLVTAQSPSPASTSIHPAPSPSPSQPQSQGTTWADKQAVVRTAQNTYRDPSTVTMADARSTASTVNSFRERHQDTINNAGQKASQWNKKYNVTGRLNSFLEKHTSPTSETPPPVHAPVASPQLQPQAPPQSPGAAASLSRRPPPPPPKKPAIMHVAASSPAPAAAAAPSPPPVPLGTKPSYG